MEPNKSTTDVYAEAREFDALARKRQQDYDRAMELLGESEINLTKAKRALAAASSNALNGTQYGLPKLVDSQAALELAERGLQQARLTVLGCAAAIRELDPASLTIRGKLHAAVIQYRAKTIPEYLAENAAVVAAYRSYQAGLIALCDALGHKPDALDENDALAQALIPPTPPTDWRAFPEAQQVHARYGEPGALLSAINKHAWQAEQRVLKGIPLPRGEAAMRETYICRSAVTLSGVHFPPGSKIDIYRVPNNDQQQLLKLAKLGRIRPITPAEELR